MSSVRVYVFYDKELLRKTQLIYCCLHCFLARIYLHVLSYLFLFQDSPVVELRFGNRMLDTSRIGPGDDVYFECEARANPSTTIRYSWYHNVSNRFHWYLFEL